MKLTKILILILSLTVIACSLFACAPNEKPDGGEKPSGHTHEYSIYSYDGENHWKKCLCGEVQEKEKHSFTDDKCVCGKYHPTYYTEGLFFKLNGYEYSVIDYVGEQTELVIPATYEGKKVTRIDYAYCAPLTSVIIGDNVVSVGANAFAECFNIASVKFGDSVKTIEANAFYKCISLEELEIVKSINSIGANAFAECRSLTDLVIPDNVTSVGSGAFSYCIKLETLKIGKGLTKLSSNMFEHCEKLDGVVIPTNVKVIDTKAFFECYSLSSMVVPDSVTSVGSQAFAWCKSLESIELGSNVLSIGSLAFFSCPKLTSLVIPYSVTSIGYYLISDSNAVTSITFEDTSTWYMTRYADEWQKRTGGNVTEVTDPNANAENFRTNFFFYWYKL